MFRVEIEDEQKMEHDARKIVYGASLAIETDLLVGHQKKDVLGDREPAGDQGQMVDLEHLEDCYGAAVAVSIAAELESVRQVDQMAGHNDDHEGVGQDAMA